MNPPDNPTERLFNLNNLNERLPIFTKGRDPKKIQATDIYLLTSSPLTASKLLLKQNTEELTFAKGVAIGSMKSFVLKDISLPITNWELKIQDLDTQIDQLWMLVRYVVTTKLPR